MMKQNKKRILFATGIFPPDIGGPATYVSMLQEKLPPLGFETRVITYSDKPALGDEEIIRIVRKKSILARYFFYFWEVLRLCTWADIVYVQGPVSEGLPAFLACKLRAKKYFLKIVGDYAWEQGMQKHGVRELLDVFLERKYGLKVEILKWIERTVAKSAKLAITPSKYLKNVVEKWGVDPDKISVVYNSIESVGPLEDREKLRVEFKIEGKLIVSIGRLVPWKGFDCLIRGFAELKDQDLKLYIIGGGPEQEDLQRTAGSLGLGERVKILGKMPRREALAYMAAADLLVLNTGYEGLSHLLIEAMQIGLPIITTDVGGNPELIRDGANGTLVKYNDKEQIKDAIIRIFADYDKAMRLAQAAKADAQNFTPDRMINELLSILNRI